MDVPRRPDRSRFRESLHKLPQRPEKVWQEDRLDRGGQREHRLWHLGRSLDRWRRQGRGHHCRRAGAIQRELDRCLGAGAAAQGQEAGRCDLHQLHRRHGALFQDHEEPRLPAADHHRRRCGVLGSDLHSECRRHRAGRGQPQRLGYRQAGQRQLHHQRDVQEEVRPRS